MDTRTTRRTAEKAARDLMKDRAALVGELAVVSAERSQLQAEVAAATERGRQLVAAAQAEAAELLGSAQARVLDADQRYADVYTATTAAGWTPADLTALGFASTPTNQRRRRPTTPDPPASGPASHLIA